MEAHKTVFTPLNQKLFEIISNKQIGQVKSIDAQYATRLTETISGWHFNSQDLDVCLILGFILFVTQIGWQIAQY